MRGPLVGSRRPSRGPAVTCLTDVTARRIQQKARVPNGTTPLFVPPSCREALMLSARNQFKGTVKSVKLGNVAAEVVITVGNLEVVSMITRGSADQLGLKPGDSVTAIIKATEVLIDK